MKTYLGDSVYAELQCGRIILTTDNGHGPSNTIVLEPEVLAALHAFEKRIQDFFAPKDPPEQAQPGIDVS